MQNVIVIVTLKVLGLRLPDDVSSGRYLLLGQLGKPLHQTGTDIQTCNKQTYR